MEAFTMARSKLLEPQPAVGFFLIGLLLAVAGCQQGQPYASGYSFYPQPVTVNVMHRGQGEETPLTTLASIMGVRRADPEHNVTGAVVARLTIENNGSASVTFDPASLQLVTGTLQSFPPPQVQPPITISIAPGQRQDVTAAFPLPPGGPEQMSLNNLRLRWQVSIEGYSVPQSALFEQGNGQAGQYTAPSPAY
jgi:hypothetical protein